MQILSTLYCDNIPENKKDLDHFSIDYKFFTGYDNKEYLSFEVSSDNEYFERAFELKNCMIGMTRYGFSNEELDSAKWLYMDSKCKKFDINEDVDTFEFDMCPKSENIYHYKRQINPYVFTSRVKWKPKNNFYSVFGGGDDIFCSPEAVSQFKQNNIIGIDFGVVNRKDGTARDDVYQMLFTEKLIREALYFPRGFVHPCCRICGEELTHLNMPTTLWYMMGVIEDKLPKNVDAFMTEDKFCEHGQQVFIVSQKVRSVIKNMNERNIDFIPLKTI